MSIMVQLECDDPECHSTDGADVYYMHWKSATPISSYLPEGWMITGQSDFGHPLVRCFEHSEE